MRKWKVLGLALMIIPLLYFGLSFAYGLIRMYNCHSIWKANPLVDDAIKHIEEDGSVRSHSIPLQEKYHHDFDYFCKYYCGFCNILEAMRLNEVYVILGILAFILGAYIFKIEREKQRKES